MENLTRFASIAIVAFVVANASANLNPGGTKCGQKFCNTTEYCSPYDTQCRPCKSACDPTNHNHQAELCVKDCQEYLHDQRYVLRVEQGSDRNVRAEIDRLATLVKISLILSLLSIVLVSVLVARTFLKIKRIREALQKIFGKKWAKKTKLNGMNNNSKNREDVETGGTVKQNGLKLVMPTISASVAPSQSTNSTPNTTSTPLSRRHPSEDTTLDYAYDNPAMTPSPESGQPRTKRESSF